MSATEAKRKVLFQPKETKVPFPYCAGCGHGLVMRMISETLAEMGIDKQSIGIGGIGCGGLGAFVVANWSIAGGPHGTAPAQATGIKRALKGKPFVFTIQGDGDCAAIGGGYLINAAGRAEKITVLMVNNTNYGTTGGQMAPTTLMGQRTTTSPYGREASWAGYPTHIPEMLSTFKGVVYTARGAVNNPANFTRTKKMLKAAFQKQVDNVGMSMVEILATCPPNWHLDPLKALERLEQEVMKEFPLGEFKNVDKIE